MMMSFYFQEVTSIVRLNLVMVLNLYSAFSISHVQCPLQGMNEFFPIVSLFLRGKRNLNKKAF